MPVLASKLNPRSDDFKANAAQMRSLVDDLNAQLARIALGGGEAARAKHTGRGKLLPRERVEMLLDPDTPFLEVAPLAALNMYPERGGVDAAPGAGPDHWHRPCQRRRVPGGVQRRHGQGRHLLPDDGQEAPARAGDR